MVALDEKAAQLLRFNTLASGLVLTAASIFSRDGDLGVGVWTLAAFSIGAAGLIGSTAMTILAHRAERLQLGLRPEGIVGALGYEIDDVDVLVEAIRSYGRGIVLNSEAKDRTVRRLQWATWSLLVAIALLALAAIGLLVERGPS